MATRKTSPSPKGGADTPETGPSRRTPASASASASAKSTRSRAAGKRARTEQSASAEGAESPAGSSAMATVDAASPARERRKAPTARRGAAARRPVDEVALYQAYFKLQRAPFSIAPDPRALFQSERHREALAHLVFGVQGGAGGFVLLTGEIGAGKTTVSRAFLEQLPAHCLVAWILNPRQSPSELLASICEEFGAPVGPVHATAGPSDALPPTDSAVAADRHGSPAEVTADEDILRLDPVLHHSTKRYVDALSRFLLARHARGFQSVLIIDEAQNLSADVLEQLRLLTNLETHDRKLLQIVLIGQPELRTMLAEPSMEQLAQRIIARYHLGPLDETEVVQYVRHRLEVAGLQGPLPFHPKALTRIHRLTRGIPRRINLLCDRALLGAYAQGQGMIDDRLVDQAQAEVTGVAPAGRWAWLDPRRWGESSLTTSVLIGLALGGLALLLAFLFKGVTAPAQPEAAGALVLPSVSAPTSPGAASAPPGVQASPAASAAPARPLSSGPQPVR